MANNTGTLVISPVRPANQADTFPTALMDEIKGGLHSINDIIDIATEVPFLRREVGMWVWDVENEKVYVCTNVGTESTAGTWVEKTFGNTYSNATAIADGLLSKEDFIAIKGLDTKFNAKMDAFVLESVTTLPVDFSDGQQYYDLATKTLVFYRGTIHAGITPTVGVLYQYNYVIYEWNGTDMVPFGNLPIATQAEAEAGINDTKVMTPLRVKEAIDKITHSYTLDFQNSVTILQDKNLEGNIRITDIQTDNVSTLTKGVTPITLPFTGTIDITNNELLAWTITRSLAGMASVGIKYIKI